MTRVRPLVFAGVGAIGYLVQTAALGLLVSGGRWPVVPATLAATEAAILHNFFWHQHWTWRDRPVGRLAAAGRLLRFNVANGGISLAGGALLMAWLVTGLGVHYLTANLVAVVACSLANYLVGDRWVFAAHVRGPGPSGPGVPSGSLQAGNGIDGPVIL
jgi:putative flippase GtrA